MDKSYRFIDDVVGVYHKEETKCPYKEEDKYKKSIEEFLKLKKPSIQLISTLIDKIVIDDEKNIEIVYKIKPLF